MSKCSIFCLKKKEQTKICNILIDLNLYIKKAGPYSRKENITEPAFALKSNIFLPVPPTHCPPNSITSLFSSHSHFFIFASYFTSFDYLRTYFNIYCCEPVDFLRLQRRKPKETNESHQTKAVASWVIGWSSDRLGLSSSPFLFLMMDKYGSVLLCFFFFKVNSPFLKSSS